MNVNKYLLAALASHGHEDTPAFAVGLRSVDREIGATDDSELHLRIDEERETYGILLPAQEPFCSIDRVYCPHPWPGQSASSETTCRR
jgi:hypothetical protein